MSTDEQIEDLIYNNADSFEIAKVLKADIKEYFTTLNEVFAQNSGKAFLVQHTKKIDTIISLAYKAVLREMFREYQPLKNSIPITLVALGSYGREQMSIKSDIDIMFVYKNISGFNAKEIIEKVLYLLWDCGLKLGHRVHEVDELFDVAQSDITIKTAIIEGRFIDGSKFLWTTISNKISQILAFDQKSFIQEKINENRMLHQKYPMTMEPNLKDGVGGFRDANLVFWIGKVLYNIQSIKQLPTTIVSEKDYKEFRMALEFLFRVRLALHIVLNKKDNRLRLEYIPAIAGMLGYKKSLDEHMKFSAKVIGDLRRVHLYSRIWVAKMLEENAMEFEPNHPLHEKNPRTMAEVLDIFNLPLEFDRVPPKFLKAMMNCKEGITMDKSLYPKVKKLFYHSNSYTIVYSFLQSIMLGYIIPPLKKVVNLPQFDGYHQYGVGVHSLKSLYHMEHLEDKRLQRIFDALSHEEQALMKLVTLLHDAGKGRERDHSIVGAGLFKEFAKELGFDETLIECGNRLILNHTLMSRVAQTEDLYSETTIYKFVNTFNSKKMLDMIYLLTYADMRGVGEDIYSNFNSHLIATLYNYSLEALEHEDILSDISKRVRKENLLKKSERFDALPKRVQKKVLSIEADLLFLKYTKNHILDIIERTHNESGDWVTIHCDNGYLVIEAVRNNNLNINFLLNKLGYLHLQNMDIFKLYDGKKYFKIEFAKRITPQERPRIEAIMAKALLIEELKQPRDIHLKREEISINCEHSKHYANMTIKSKNQEGLMSYLMGIFDRLGVDIISAKIYTYHNQVEDLFLIDKNGNFCTNQTLIIDELENKGEVK